MKLSVDVIHAPTIYEAYEFRVQHRAGMVRLLAGRRMVELRTVAAVEMGVALCTEVAPEEALQLDINGEKFALPPSFARQIGAGLIRKADEADDWQLTNLKPNGRLQ